MIDRSRRERLRANFCYRRYCAGCRVSPITTGLSVKNVENFREKVMETMKDMLVERVGQVEVM